MRVILGAQASGTKDTALPMKQGHLSSPDVSLFRAPTHMQAQGGTAPQSWKPPAAIYQLATPWSRHEAVALCQVSCRRSRWQQREKQHRT